MNVDQQTNEQQLLNGLAMVMHVPKSQAFTSQGAHALAQAESKIRTKHLRRAHQLQGITQVSTLGEVTRRFQSVASIKNRIAALERELKQKNIELRMPRNNEELLREQHDLLAMLPTIVRQNVDLTMRQIEKSMTFDEATRYVSVTLRKKRQGRELQGEPSPKRNTNYNYSSGDYDDDDSDDSSLDEPSGLGEGSDEPPLLESRIETRLVASHSGI